MAISYWNAFTSLFNAADSSFVFFDMEYGDIK